MEPFGAVAGGASALIADPDDAHRQYVQDTLVRGGFRTTSSGMGQQLLSAACGERLFLAVIEVRLGDMSGYAVCRQLRVQHGVRVGIVLLSGDRTDPDDRVAGLLLGADDYLAKPIIGDELLARAHALMRRLVVLDEHVRTSDAPLPPLTDRELEVLRLLADGLGQRDIAERLVIAHSTAGKHIEHILRKLSVPSRAAAVAMAYRLGLASAA